jgi:hypothetical protein
MRVPVSHPIVLTAALCLTAAAPGESSQPLVWSGLSVSEKLRIIRESASSRETPPANKRSLLAQSWRNCISGYWRNC